MLPQSASKTFSLDELQQLCDECRQSIDGQSDSHIKQAMERVCERCQRVREDIPALVELRKHIHEMKEKYPGEVA